MILVTGAAGYIGSHFVKTYLARANTQIIAVDNLSEGHQESLDYCQQVKFIKEDIGNVAAMKSIFASHKIDAVVHFAGSINVGESQENPSKYFHNNVTNSLNLLQAMDDSSVKKIVFSSTCATYGNPQSVPIDENHPQQPINNYGTTKLIIEQALQSYASSLNWSCIALRYFNVAGADDSGLIGESHNDETHLIPRVLKTALGKMNTLEIYGDDYETADGTCIRDYIHVNDLCRAHCQALELLDNMHGFDAINLGTTHGASIKEILTVSQKIIGKPIPVKICPRRSGDPPKLIANANKAKHVLGWQPQYDLEKTVATAWKWEQNKRY